KRSSSIERSARALAAANIAIRSSTSPSAPSSNSGGAAARPRPGRRRATICRCRIEAARMLRRLLIVICLAALLGGSAGALLSAMEAAAVESAPSLGRDDLLALLHGGDFDRLDAVLGAVDDDVSDRRRPEHDLTQAFNAFATSDPEVTRQLEAWVQARPQSA